MDPECISPYIRTALDSIIDTPWSLRERVIFDYELLYVKEGEALITVEDDSYTARAGDVFLFKPKQKHSISASGKTPFRQPHIHFDLFYRQDSPQVRISFKPLEQMTVSDMDLFREDVTGAGIFELPNKLSIGNIKYLEQCIFEIVEEFQGKKPFYEFIVKGLFIRLWTYIIRENFWNKNPVVLSNIDELNRVKDYLTFHINREISMDELAGEFRISKYHLNRLFKKAFGVAPIHYHQAARMEKAKEAILYRGTSLTDIAEIFGFSSINAFSRAFKNAEGVPPSFYRNRG